MFDAINGWVEFALFYLELNLLCKLFRNPTHGFDRCKKNLLFNGNMGTNSSIISQNFFRVELDNAFQYC